MMEDRVIVTAANSAYFGSLVHMLGSLFSKSPVFGAVLVYDLGLTSVERFVLANVSRVAVRRVPRFCAHYMDVENFAWKTAAICDALKLGKTVLWLDAGTEIQSSLDDLFSTIEQDGYLFTVTPLDHPNCRIGHLSHRRSLELLGADSEHIRNALMVNAGVMGYLGGHPATQIAVSAMEYAANPEIIIGPRHTHRHDQTIYSVLRVKNGLRAQYNIFQLESVNSEFPFLVRAWQQEIVPAERTAAWKAEDLHIYLLITRDRKSFAGPPIPFRSHAWLAPFFLWTTAVRARAVAKLRPPYRRLRAAARRFGSGSWSEAAK
jgi:hypothetical protein